MSYRFAHVVFVQPRCTSFVFLSVILMSPCSAPKVHPKRNPKAMHTLLSICGVGTGSATEEMLDLKVGHRLVDPIFLEWGSGGARPKCDYKISQRVHAH